MTLFPLFLRDAQFVITKKTTTVIAVLSVAKWDYIVVTSKDCSMPQGQVIEVNGIRYEAVEDNPLSPILEGCQMCDYKRDHNDDCGAFCCEMGLYNCHFKRLD